MRQLIIRNYPLHTSETIRIPIEEEDYKIPGFNFSVFLDVNKNNINDIFTKIIQKKEDNKTYDTHTLHTNFIKKLYEVCCSPALIHFLQESYAKCFDKSSNIMLYIEKELILRHSSYILDYQTSTYNYLYHSRATKNDVSYSKEPTNDEEKIVNTNELAILLATTKLIGQGLVLEKEKEKFSSYLKEYNSLIEKCIATKNDDSSFEEESSKVNPLKNYVTFSHHYKNQEINTIPVSYLVNAISDSLIESDDDSPCYTDPDEYDDNEDDYV
jgi:hypothetical protein